MYVHTALTELCICTRTHASFLSPSESSTKQCACLHGYKDTLYTLHRQLLRENVIFDRKDKDDSNIYICRHQIVTTKHTLRTYVRMCIAMHNDTYETYVC